MKTKNSKTVFLYLIYFIVVLLSSSQLKAQATYGQTRLKCKDCLLIDVLRQATTEYKDGNYGNAIPYYNLYLTITGNKDPNNIENLAESYWQNKIYDSAANWFSKIQTPLSKKRLNEYAALKKPPQNSSLKFF